MKKLIHILSASIVLILIASACKKSSVASSNQSQWKVNNKTYIGNTTVFGGTYFESNAYPDSTDSLTNILVIGFSQRPVANGKFAVVGETTTPNSKECILVAAKEYPSSPLTQGDISIGNPGDSVTVTIVNGKITATFSSIIVQDVNKFYTSISGKLIEQ
jgi:hypothetical protein